MLCILWPWDFRARSCSPHTVYITYIQENFFGCCGRRTRNILADFISGVGSHDCKLHDSTHYLISHPDLEDNRNTAWTMSLHYDSMTCHGCNLWAHSPQIEFQWLGRVVVLTSTSCTYLEHCVQPDFGAECNSCVMWHSTSLHVIRTEVPVKPTGFKIK